MDVNGELDPLTPKAKIPITHLTENDGPHNLYDCEDDKNTHFLHCAGPASGHLHWNDAIGHRADGGIAH